MKKGVLSLIFSLLATGLFAERETVGGITWQYTVSGWEAKIGRDDYSSAIPMSTSGAITIPSTLGGYPVTSIGSYAFYNCSSLTSVTIPEGVTSIGGHAFFGCSGLTSVAIPSSVTSIGDSAFSGVAPEVLAAAWLPDGISTDNLKTLIIPEGVTSIGDSAFYNCSSLTSVTIPKGVTSIGRSAFYNCSSLTSVTIPEGVTSIGWFAFSGCSSLTSVTIPEGVTSIGSYAFSGCSSLTSVTIPEGETSIGIYAFYGCKSLTSVTIPEGVTSIGWDAFRGCSSLTSVTIPESVTSIGDRVFDGCSSLTSVIFKGVPPQECDTFESRTTGYYFVKNASEWEKVIEADGTWNGLTMVCMDKSVVVAVNGGGSVTGAGWYATGSSVTLTAVPNGGYVFCGWSDSSAKSATYTFTMPNEAVEVTAYFADATAVNAYVAMNNLMPKDDAVQKALDADEVFTADEMKALALGAPVIQVKDGKAVVRIQVQQASELDGEWEAVEGGEVSVTVPADEKAGFYKFVVPNQH